MPRLGGGEAGALNVFSSISGLERVNCSIEGSEAAGKAPVPGVKSRPEHAQQRCSLKPPSFLCTSATIKILHVSLPFPGWERQE